ncbi:MAG: PKD domain-containing protein [Bacteroidia bacterium]
MRLFLPKLYRNINFVVLLFVLAFYGSSNGQNARIYTPPNVITGGCTPDSVIFSYTGSNQTFVVPCGVTSITVKAWGGGGGGGGTDGSGAFFAPGGGGAYASSTLVVASGTSLTVVVGGGGGAGVGCQSGTGGGKGGFGLGNGGNGGNPGSSGCSGPGGGGGGGTGLENGGTVLIVAGGGGGAGGGETNGASAGPGGGGGQNGSPGNSSTDGTIAASGTMDGISATMPTDDNPGGGGGGGGLLGGGCGAVVTCGANCSGGAGGAGGTSSGSTVINGAGITPGNSANPDIAGGLAVGGAVGVAGGNGLLVITYCATPAATISTASTNVTCYNDNNGTATVTVTSGTGPFTYSWAPSGGNAATASNLAPGTYTATVTNSLGCSVTSNVTITQPPQLRDSISAFTNESSCGTNGSATVGVKGGGGIYTYSWAPGGGNAATANNLTAGTYTVTVTDNDNCIVTANVTITKPGPLVASIAGSNNVSCNGGSNGSVTAGITGGNSPYTYTWSNGESSAKDSLLPAGSYSVIITDATGCTITTATVITQPAALRDSMAVTIEVLCFGGNTGSVTDGTAGGTGPYNYSWNTAPAQATQTASNLAAGSYTVDIADANGCKDSAFATITQPTPLTLAAGPFPATCFDSCNGLATVIPSGGTGPYTYLWSSGSTEESAKNLCAGNYSVKVTDFNGCVHDTTLTVIQPSPVSIFDKTTTIANCNKPDGSASISDSGGTPGYTYKWSNGATTQNLTNVTPGDYCVLVIDKHGCIDTACVIVPNKPGVATQIVATTTVTCFDSANGTATDTAVGGTPPYTYKWNDGQTTSTATGLSAGIDSVVVVDANGCIDVSVATITQPPVVLASANVSSATICIGTKDTLTVGAIGGNAPYTYTWQAGNSTGTPIIVSPDTTTTYTVTTADINKCPGAPVTVTVIVNPPIKVLSGAPVAMCPGKTDTVYAKASGGDGTYTYTWASGGTVGQIIPVSPGATMYYTVTVHDNCSTPPMIDSMEVIVDPLPNVKFAADTVNACSTLCTGFTDATTIASGGLESWNWNFGDGNTSTAQNPRSCYTAPGIYDVSLTVTSDSGCPSSLTLNNMITVYSHPQTNFTASPQPTNITNPNITFTDKTTDAYGIVQWEWNLGDSLSGPFLDTSNLQNPIHIYSDTGTFCIKLLDINKHGCTDSATVCIEISPLYTFYIPNAFTPNADGIDDYFAPKGGDFSTFAMWIFNRWGQQIYYTTDINKGWNGSVNNGGVLCQEDTYVYLIEVKDFMGIDHTYMGKVTLIR